MNKFKCPYCGDGMPERDEGSKHWRCEECRVLWMDNGKIIHTWRLSDECRMGWYDVSDGTLIVKKEMLL